MSPQQPSGGTRTADQSRTRPAVPPLFQVLMHNDHYTTMEFVVRVLETIFHKAPTEANRIMLNVHMGGVGLCGIYPFEIAETKVLQVHGLARKEGFPLKCSLEEA